MTFDLLAEPRCSVGRRPQADLPRYFQAWQEIAEYTEIFYDC